MEQFCTLFVVQKIISDCATCFVSGETSGMNQPRNVTQSQSAAPDASL